MDKKFEEIWLKLRPTRLHWGLSCVIVANVYHPQTDKGAKDSDMLIYLLNSKSAIMLPKLQDSNSRRFQQA